MEYATIHSIRNTYLQNVMSPVVPGRPAAGPGAPGVSRRPRLLRAEVGDGSGGVKLAASGRAGVVAGVMAQVGAW